MDEIAQGNDQTLQKSVDSSAALLTSLQTRANALLAELKAYQCFLQSKQKYREVEIRVFRRGLESEVKSLDTITKKRAVYEADAVDFSDAEVQDELRHLHAVRSSNLPHYEAVWSIARQCRGILGLGKRVYWSDSSSPYSDKNGYPFARLESCGRTSGSARKGVLVDIVAEDGLEWIKVSAISEKRLIFEMAKEGWAGYDDETDYSDTESASGCGKLEIIRLAEDLRSASLQTRIRFCHPHVRFVLPRISEGSLKDVDAVIADLRATGATVECHGSHPAWSNPQFNDPLSRPDFQRLLPSPSPFSPALTPTLNIDCTLLLALISDISHFPRSDLVRSTDTPAGTYHAAITRQIATEASNPLLPNELYPLLNARKLTCTAPAAQRMREIVRIMGTHSESERAAIIFREGVHKDKSAAELRSALADMSRHKVAEELELPIHIVQFDGQSTGLSEMAAEMETFPSAIARRAAEAMRLSPINTSVFLYGWATNVVTVTSNKVVATGLVKTINELLNEWEEEGGVAERSRELKDFRGPEIYVCETARSLVGKDKPRKDDEQ